MTTKFTPGPWRISTTGNLGNLVEAQSGKKIYENDSGWRTVATFQACTSSNLAADEGENKIANGRLIAAAPAMYEALRFAIECGERDGLAAAMAVLNTQGRAALAHAEGQP